MTASPIIQFYMKKFHLILLTTLLLPCCAPKDVLPKAPDYGDETMWFVEERDSSGMGADVFYAVSTWELDWVNEKGDTVHYADVWNPSHRERMARELKRAADYMAPGNRFYAPYYRHITFENWVKGDTALIERRARVAMKDVCDAFDTFQARRDTSRPLIIAGFSQGGMAVVRLLPHMDEKAYGKLVAAYVLGYGVTARDTLCPHIRPARGASDIGVTICYNTVKDTAFVIPCLCADNALCINPVNWRTDSTTAILHDTIRVSVSPEKHVLVVKNYAASEYPPVMNFINVGDIHSCEPWLYSECLKENFALRTARWREKFTSQKYSSEPTRAE